MDGDTEDEWITAFQFHQVKQDAGIGEDTVVLHLQEGLLPAFCKKMVVDRRHVRSRETLKPLVLENATVPQWVWESCTKGYYFTAKLNYRAGTFEGWGFRSGERIHVRLFGLKFKAEAVNDLAPPAIRKVEPQSFVRPLTADQFKPAAAMPKPDVPPRQEQSTVSSRPVVGRAKPGPPIDYEWRKKVHDYCDKAGETAIRAPCSKEAFLRLVKQFYQLKPSDKPTSPKRTAEFREEWLNMKAGLPPTY